MGVVFTFAVLIAIALWVLVWILGEVGVLIAISLRSAACLPPSFS